MSYKESFAEIYTEKYFNQKIFWTRIYNKSFLALFIRLARRKLLHSFRYRKSVISVVLLFTMAYWWYHGKHCSYICNIVGWHCMKKSDINDEKLELNIRWFRFTKKKLNFRWNQIYLSSLEFEKILVNEFLRAFQLPTNQKW